MNPSVSSMPHAWPRLHRFAVDAAITALFNVLIAVIITYVIRLHSNFVVNLTVSMCIGMLAVTFIDGGRLLFWGLKKPPVPVFVLLVAVALPTAQYLGNLIAS